MTGKQFVSLQNEWWAKNRNVAINVPPSLGLTLGNSRLKPLEVPKRPKTTTFGNGVKGPQSGHFIPVERARYPNSGADGCRILYGGPEWAPFPKPNPTQVPEDNAHVARHTRVAS
ncbi:MAG: hypothetical protein CM15mP125_4050 [Gammaproteobacteria bacterium]|nr:MAG: hypothetical protein CM15mP125_4050 [Gammaproteobacteria bacterium]